MDFFGFYYLIYDPNREHLYAPKRKEGEGTGVVGDW